MENNKILKVGIIQQSNTADAADNRRRIAEAVERLARQGAKLIVNRELHEIGRASCRERVSKSV